jgi:hypothetical protein
VIAAFRLDHLGREGSDQEDPEQPASTRSTVRKRTFPKAAWDDPQLFMPTLDDLERQVRSRPIGRSILDICLDLAVVPGFCHGQFWNELFDITNYFGGSVDRLMRQKARRQHAFCQEPDRKPNSNRNWLRMKRDELRQVLGSFIAEPLVDPLGSPDVIATGPP